jgi:hypothetical protein
MVETSMNIHSASRELFVWVNPNDWMAQLNSRMTGSFVQPSPGNDRTGVDNLMFVFNPRHTQTDISRFHLTVINNYRIEYDLEKFRHQFHPDLPSRLFAIFLFENRQDALLYRESHLPHVAERVLKRAVTVGEYIYSLHDLAWIDFLRELHVMDSETLNICWNGYWRGERMQDRRFESRGRVWNNPSIFEALFYGRIEFPNREISEAD